MNQEKINYENISSTPQPVKKFTIHNQLQRSPSWHPNLTSTPFVIDGTVKKTALQKNYYVDDGQRTKRERDLEQCQSISINFASSSLDSGFSSNLFSSDYESVESCSLFGLENDQRFTKIKETTKFSNLSNDKIDNETTDYVLNCVLRKILPQIPDCLIGRKIGEDFYDIIDNLSNLNSFPALNLLFSYLNDVDLVRCASVSRQWRKCFLDNPSVASRLNQFLYKRRSYKEKTSLQKKENSPKKDDPAAISRPMTRSKPLNVIQNLGCKLQTATANFFRRSPNKINDRSPPSKHETFVKEAKKLKKGERLTKCPLCESPAKVLPVMDKGTCSKFECSYEFCTRCRGPFHSSFDDCTVDPSRETVQTMVGSEKSKNNLRRLFK